jgi:hypothetical protein
MATPKPTRSRTLHPQRLREPEVHQLRTRLRQHDIARLEVAVNNAVAIREGQSLCNSNSNLVYLSEREHLHAQAVGQRLAFEQLHYEIIGSVGDPMS